MTFSSHPLTYKERLEFFKKAADVIVSEGYKATRYKYVMIDDCWLEKNTSHNKLQLYKKTDLPNNSLKVGASKNVYSTRLPEHENEMKRVNFLLETLIEFRDNR